MLRGNSPLCHNDVSTGFDYGNSVGVQQLSIPLANFSKLKLESSLLVKYLDPVVIGVGHNYVILSIDCHPTWFSELSLKYSKLTKFTVIDHLLTFDLRF